MHLPVFFDWRHRMKSEAVAGDIQNNSAVVGLDVNVGEFFESGTRNLAAFGRGHTYTWNQKFERSGRQLKDEERRKRAVRLNFPCREIYTGTLCCTRTSKRRNSAPRAAFDSNSYGRAG